MQQPEVASGNGGRSQARDAQAPTSGAPDPSREASATADRDAQALPRETALGATLEHDRALDEVWRRLQRELAKRVKREQFETWFRRARLRRATSQGVCLAVQNTFARDWLKKNYQPALEQSVCAVFGEAWPIEYEVAPELIACDPPARDPAQESAEASEDAAADAACGSEEGSAAARPPGASPSGASSSGAGRSRAANAASASGSTHAPPSGSTWPSSNRLLWASDVALNPNYRFDGFVVGPCNRFAHAAAVGVSEAPGQNYNPFFLHGSVGLGKTHLLQSLCYALLDRTPDTRILYLSCETFTNHFIAALENGDLEKFRNKYRNVDVLVVDDIHMLANKERTQEEFFHTFNTLYNAGSQIVLSSDSPPKEIPTLQERLVSRFKWGLVTEIEAPCYETRMAILKRKSKERGRELPDAVASLLAEHIDTNIRELEGAVTRVLGYAALSGQEVSIDLARKVLRDVFTSQRGLPTMDDVMRVVTAHFNVKATELQGRRRTNAIARPRQVGMFLARRITRHSLEEIGGFFGGRDHSTVLHGIEKVEKEIGKDERFRALIASFLEQLQRNSG